MSVGCEEAGLIQVSSRAATVGTILSMNAAALKLFGYSRRNAVGRPIDIIVPDPIAGIHEQLLQRWVSTGINRFINGGTRFMMGQHRLG